MVKKASSLEPARLFRMVPSLVAMTLVTVTAIGVPRAVAATRSNDEPSGATAIHHLPFDDATSTVDATAAATDPATCLPSNVGVGHTVWYSLRSHADGAVTATTSGSDFDTVVAVYARDKRTGTMNMVACNDDSDGTLASAVQFDAPRKGTYLLMVGSFAGGPGGNLAFHVG